MKYKLLPQYLHPTSCQAILFWSRQGLIRTGENVASLSCNRGSADPGGDFFSNEIPPSSIVHKTSLTQAWDAPVKVLGFRHLPKSLTKSSVAAIISISSAAY